MEYEFFQNLSNEVKNSLVTILDSTFDKMAQGQDFQLYFSVFKFLSSLVEFNDEEELIMFSKLSSKIFSCVEFILDHSKFSEDQLSDLLDEIDFWLEYGGKLNFSKI